MSGLNPPLDDETPVSTRGKVAFLREAGHYAVATESVHVIETHMSWVFLTDERVYKLKKPVRYEFLDFSTLEARRLDCEREVQLNRRLAGDVYIGTLPLTEEKDRGLKLGGTGEPVDWLVEMQRLPESRSLEAAIGDRTVAEEDIDRISALLNDFYRRLQPVAMSAEEYLQVFAGNVEESHETLSRQEYELPAEEIQTLTLIQRRFLERHGDLLEQRISKGAVIEGHGDLRPEHVFLTDPPVIIDCLEFNRSFRLIDPVDELGYLALECDRLGAAWIGDRLLQNYTNETGDDYPDILLSFYRLFRVCLRGKIAVWHIDDHEIDDTEKWLRRAKDYLHVAQRDIRVLDYLISD